MATYPNYNIVGCQTGRGPNGEVPLRLNVRDLYKDHKDKWALYVLGLRLWYDKDPSDALSYFQVAGIHGMPYVEWNGEDIRMNGKVPTGYCFHSTVLFPSWHRPYLVLYEQRLQQIMLEEIIPKISGAAEQAKYKRAAEIFRIPYWDWATPPQGASEAQILEWLPPTCTESTVRNPIPGFDSDIANPLYRFVLKGRDGKKTMGDYGVEELHVDATRVVDYEKCVGLSRCPDDPYYEDQAELQVANQQNPGDVKTWEADWPEKWREGEIRSLKVYDSFTSEMGWLDPNIPRPQHGIAENVHRMFAYALDYVDFATNGGVPSKGEDLDKGQWFQSLEAIHNNIHWWVGGNHNGHMAQVPVASFDPFFWLHHANIERFYCMWQFMNPDKWFEERSEIFTDATGVMLDKDGNVVQDEKQATRVTVGPTTPLTPFKNKSGQYYDSNQVRDHTKFNYTYPQLQTWNHPSRQVHMAALLKEINQKYGGHRKQTLGGKSEAGCLEVVVNVTFSKFLFQGYPFNINLYLQHGDKKNPKVDFIGQAYNFSAPASRGGQEVCSNCTRLQGKDAKCSAQLVISQLLPYFKHYPGAGNIDISNCDQVEKFLKQRLYVKIFATSGREIIPNNQTQQVTVAVAHNRMRYSGDDSKLPEFEAFENFASLAGDIARLLVVAPGAFVLSATGAVLGTLNETGEVLVNGQLKKLEELNNLKLESFEHASQAARHFISTVTNPPFEGSRQDEDNSNNRGGGLGGFGGGFFR